MSKFKFILLSFLVFNFSNLIIGWDRIQVKTFMTIFPYSNQPDVWKLTFDVNHQDDLESSQKVLNDWMASKWTSGAVTGPQMVMKKDKVISNQVEKLLMNTTDTDNDSTNYENATIFKIRSLADKEFARYQALGFLEHRWTIKMFVRNIYRTIQMAMVLNETEAGQMRELFWQSDAECLNYFRCTGPMFFNKTAETFGTSARSSGSIMSHLYVYGIAFAAPIDIAKQLNWKLEGAPSRVPDIDFGYNGAGTY